MNIHKNAKLTPSGRERLVRAMLGGDTPAAAAREAGVCRRTARKWLKRFEQEGAAGLIDRCSRPKRPRSPTPQHKADEVIALRRQRLPGKEIAIRAGLSPATVSRILRKAKLSRSRDLDPPLPPRRYEHSRHGAMIHMDVKKLGRFSGIGHRITGNRATATRTVGRGWEFVHVAIDDNSRIAFSLIMPDEKQESSIAFLKAARAYYKVAGHQDRAGDDRQWLLLQGKSLRHGLQAAWHQAYPYQALHATNQRQGRTLHQNRPQ